MKKLLSGIIAAAALASLTACGSDSSDSGSKVTVYDEGEIGETGKFELTSWSDLSFDKNGDGTITAKEINSYVPDFALYPFGDGFMGLADAKEKAEKIYAVKVPISIDGSDYTLNMSFNKDQELLDWYIMFFQTWSQYDSASTIASDYRASIEKFDECFGTRTKDAEQEGSDTIVTAWKDGGYTLDATITFPKSGAYTQVHYTKD